MKFLPNISIEVFRNQLATANALPQLALLGLLTGVITALVIAAFRSLIEHGSTLLLGLDADESYEQLTVVTRVAWCLGGAVLLATLLHRYSPSARRVGVVHVMERLSRHQGYLPLKNAVIQFFGGAIALISGQSGGREGPAIHLGATTASLLGQSFHLPNNSIRTMVACGTASAIAASFNTPIAGVIFAMEVVMMEYTIASFIPIIVASVAATLTSQMFFGNAPAFNIAPVSMTSLLEIPYLLVGGIFIGGVAAGFNQMVQRFAKLSQHPFWLRIIFAGSLTAAIAIVFPSVMGIGYDTVNEIMLGELSILLLVALLFAKALTSAASVGLGMPIGLIGPTMFLGACTGGIFGNLLLQVQETPISVGLYVVLGMCAMMAAVLQAPLAALMAVMEMTANTNIILPAMVIIVAATLVTSHVFHQGSVYLTTLKTLGLQYPPNPVALHLQRIGVTAIMDRSFARLAETIPQQRALEVLANDPHWILVESKDGSTIRAALNPSDLRAFLEEPDEQEPFINLLEIPGQRMDVTYVDVQATANEAVEALAKSEADVCCIHRTTAPMIKPIIGVITQHHLDNYRKRST